jgi:hypothetical protein
MSNAVEQGIHFLNEFGLFDVILPFILFFTICYGLLQRIKIFGNDSKKYNLLIGLIFGFFTVYQLQLTEKLPLFLARVGLLFVISVAIIIIGGLLGIHEEYSGNVTILVLLSYMIYNIVEIFFGFTIIWKVFGSYFDLGLVAPIITALFVFVSIVWFITRGKEPGDTESENRINIPQNLNKENQKNNKKYEETPIEINPEQEKKIKKLQKEMEQRAREILEK